MKDFTTIDCAILSRIASGACTFTSINASVEHHAKPHAGPRGDTFRVVDRRLQSLRKRGIIHFDNTKWFITPLPQEEGIK